MHMKANTALINYLKKIFLFFVTLKLWARKKPRDNITADVENRKH